MFAYCNNNPAIYVDSSGERIVGVGLQGEVSIGGVSVGVEIVIYFDPEVCDGQKCSVVMYTYGGYELSSSQLDEITSMIDVAVMGACLDLSSESVGEADFLTYFATTAAAEMINGILSKDGTATGAFFYIDGNEAFDEPDDYSGKFYSGSATGTVAGRTGGLYYAVSPTCTAVGIKYGRGYSAKPNPLRAVLDWNIGFSVTYYSQPYVLY